MVEPREEVDSPDRVGIFDRLPADRCFFGKSAEWIEKKRLEFLVDARKSKRVRKNLKRKQGLNGSWAD
jgi:hypothetical protein